MAGFPFGAARRCCSSSNLPASLDSLIEHWAGKIASNHVFINKKDAPEYEKERETKLLSILHKDLSSARSWKVARWSNGLRNLFNAAVDTKVDIESEDDDSSV